MPLSDIVRVTVSLQTGGLTQQGFGMPMILAVNAAYPERVRFYADVDSVADDFAVTTPEYLAATAIFSQDPHPPLIAIGRRALIPTQRWTVTVASVLNSTAYKIRLNDPAGAESEVTVNSDTDALNDEIVDGFVTAINLLSAAVTASAVGSVGSKVLVIVADNAGDFFGVELLDTTGNTGANALSLLSITQTTDDPGVATDLAAIAAENNDWYGIVSLFNSEAEVTAIATYAEANEKLFVAAIQDSATVTAAAGGTDTADDLSDAGRFRTAAIYHPANDAFVDAAWLGKCLPFDPGSETWMFKTLAGVPVYTLTGTHIVNLKAKNCNYYYEVAGRSITAEGKVAADEFIDVIRFRDWYKARLQERIALALFNAKKIPYTDAGISIIGAEIYAQNAEGIRVGGIAEDPAPEVTLPRAADANPVDKAARLLRGVKTNWTLAGAIHEIEITATVVA